jgi:hypothetical protein
MAANARSRWFMWPSLQPEVDVDADGRADRGAVPQAGRVLPPTDGLLGGPVEAPVSGAALDPDAGYATSGVDPDE